MPLVVNLDLPIVAEDYVHRIGRTGRAGNKGEAISLVCADEVQLLAAIEVLTRQTLPRHEEPDFIPDHRVPMTDASGRGQEAEEAQEAERKQRQARVGALDGQC